MQITGGHTEYGSSALAPSLMAAARMPLRGPEDSTRIAPFESAVVLGAIAAATALSLGEGLAVPTVQTRPTLSFVEQNPNNLAA